MNHEDIPSVDGVIARVHGSLQRDLAATLPIDKGLAALIGPDSPVDDLPELVRIVRQIAALPLHQRLQLRTQLPTAELAEAQTIARRSLQAFDILRLVTSNPSHARALALGLVRDLGSARTIALELAVALDFVRDRDSVRPVDLDFVREVDPGAALACGLARDLARGLALDLARALDLVPALAQGLTFDLDLERAFTLARAFDAAVDRAYHLAIDFARACDFAPDPDRHVTQFQSYVDGVDALVRALDSGEGADLTHESRCERLRDG